MREAGFGSWTDARIALLTQLREEGKLSRPKIAAFINAQTGSNFTKGAISGKIDRIFPVEKPRLTPEQRAFNKAECKRVYNQRKRDETRAKRVAAGLPLDMPHGQPRIRIVRASGNSANQRIVVTPDIAQPKLRCVEVVPLNLTLAQLDQETQCHYIPGDDLLYCGHPRFTYLRGGKEIKSAYCAPHYGVTVGAGTDSERRAA
jgi:hypothetical protein